MDGTAGADEADGAAGADEADGTAGGFGVVLGGKLGSAAWYATASENMLRRL